MVLLLLPVTVWAAVSRVVRIGVVDLPTASSYEQREVRIRYGGQEGTPPTPTMKRDSGVCWNPPRQGRLPLWSGGGADRGATREKNPRAFDSFRSVLASLAPCSHVACRRRWNLQHRQAVHYPNITEQCTIPPLPKTSGRSRLEEGTCAHFAAWKSRWQPYCVLWRYPLRFHRILLLWRGSVLFLK